MQSQSSDNEFRGVSERRIEQPANAGTHLLCHVLCRLTHQASQRDNRKTGGHKDGDRGGMAELQESGHWQKNEKPVQPIFDSEKFLHEDGNVAAQDI